MAAFMGLDEVVQNPLKRPGGPEHCVPSNVLNTCVPSNVLNTCVPSNVLGVLTLRPLKRPEHLRPLKRQQIPYAHVQWTRDYYHVFQKH